MMKSCYLYRFLIFTSLFGLSLAGRALEQEHRSEIDKSRPTVAHPTEIDLQMYLEVLEAREEILEKANEALLREADYSIVKIPMFMAKAAMDGYFFGRLLGLGGATTAAGQAAVGAAAVGVRSVSHRALEWVKSGGLERMKSLGFNVGVIGVSAANNTLLLPGYRWQYGVPIYGTAYAAYLWSEQLMNSPELIEQNGREILKIRKEKHRIRRLLEKS